MRTVTSRRAYVSVSLPLLPPSIYVGVSLLLIPSLPPNSMRVECSHLGGDKLEVRHRHGVDEVTVDEQTYLNHVTCEGDNVGEGTHYNDVTHTSRDCQSHFVDVCCG